MKRLVSLLLSCLLLSSCGTIVTPAKTPPEHLVSEAPPAQVLPAPGEMPELLPDSQEAGGENASEPSPEEGGGTPVETLPEPQRVAVMSYYNAEMSVKEIAQLLGEDAKQFDNQTVTFVCTIVKNKIMTTKSNTLMAFTTVEDLTGSMEMIVFPRILAECRAAAWDCTSARF